MIDERGFEGDREDPFEAESLELSVVIPVRDEQGNLPALLPRLARVLDDLGAAAEVIFVDDGSGDATPAILARAHETDPRFRSIVLSRNFGHQVAISAGLRHARGEVTVVMDGDLQDPPEAIGALWARLREGFDVVYAIRRGRPEPPLKRWAYALFYRILRRSASVPIPIDAGDFGIMTRRVVDLICEMPEPHRFLRGMRAWVGFRQTGLPIDRSARHRGRSKFTLPRLLGLAFDGFFGFAPSPLRALGLIGLASALAATGLLAMLACGLAPIRGLAPGWSLLAALVTFFGGLTLLSTAVLGEYLTRILDAARGRPLYVVRRRIGVAERRTAPYGGSGFGDSAYPGARYWDGFDDDPLRDSQPLSG